jgi:hypothetical protein
MPVKLCICVFCLSVNPGSSHQMSVTRSCISILCISSKTQRRRLNVSFVEIVLLLNVRFSLWAVAPMLPPVPAACVKAELGSIFTIIECVSFLVTTKTPWGRPSFHRSCLLNLLPCKRILRLSPVRSSLRLTGSLHGKQLCNFLSQVLNFPSHIIGKSLACRTHAGRCHRHCIL